MLDVQVQKRFSDFAVDAAFSAASTGVTALFGRSGAGKTSVVNMIAGLVRPERGRIAIDDRVLFDSEARVNLKPERRRIGYVFQEGRLFPHLSVRANLLYGMRFAPSEERYVEPERIIGLLGIEGLLDRRPPTLSGGEKQRVAIGRALLSQPRLLLMDEPLAALDAERKGEILSYIDRLRDEVRVPIVYVSHAVEEVARLADTLVLLSGGAVAAVGPPAEIMSRLDLGPLTGRHEAGALISCRVESHDTAFGLTSLRFAGGVLRVAHVDAPLGMRMRVRIRARDVSIATTKPVDVSILNVFRGRIVERDDRAGAVVELRLDIGVPLRARVTARSASDLGLEPGKEVYAMVKSVAIDQHSLGLAAPRAREG